MMMMTTVLPDKSRFRRELLPSTRRETGKRSWVPVAIAGVLLVVMTVGWAHSGSSRATFHPVSPSVRSTSYSGPPLTIFSAHVDKNPVLRRALVASDKLSHVVLTAEQQQDFIRNSECTPGVLMRYQELIASQNTHLAQELWKYCALALHGGMYIDAESPLLVNLDDFLMQHSTHNLAVWSDPSFPNTLHGSLLLLREPHSEVANSMLQLLMQTPVQTLDASPLLIPRTLHDLVLKQQPSADALHEGINGNDWWLLEQHCSVDPLRTQPSSERLTYHCPIRSGYCCHIYDQNDVILMTRHPLLPFQILPSVLPKPYNAEAGHYLEDELPFISTVRETVIPRPDDAPMTPNFFETLLKNDCLPSDMKCSLCLRNKDGATCESCKKECPCYCKSLCHLSVEDKLVSKELTVTPPLYSKDPSRIVPRIIHQTWFEEVTKEKYPNMSRLIESFKQSGWEYKFYTDDIARNFLSTHFPSEVREAYDALRPGAFKADLFRYCVLLIHGGVYADMDVMLESNLDAAVPPDVGFMVPIDEPGKQVGRRMCLWNGLIAAAPGHPFLARVIETVVNNVRNRFTSVDMDNLFCPNPELSVLHAFDTLFTAGPCILGATVNKVLGRPGQTQFEAGNIEPVNSNSASFVKGVDDRPDLRIPGRTVVLHQDKWDMGAHRFTLLDQNMVVAATDMPDYDDRKQLQDNEHYSNTHVKTGIYGLEKLYIDNNKANEDLRFFVDSKSSRYKDQIM